MALFEIKMTEKEIVDGLRSNYGKEFTAPDVRYMCCPAMLVCVCFCVCVSGVVLGV